MFFLSFRRARALDLGRALKKTHPRARIGLLPIFEKNLSISGNKKTFRKKNKIISGDKKYKYFFSYVFLLVFFRRPQ